MLETNLALLPTRVAKVTLTPSQLSCFPPNRSSPCRRVSWKVEIFLSETQNPQITPAGLLLLPCSYLWSTVYRGCFSLECSEHKWPLPLLPITGGTTSLASSSISSHTAELGIPVPNPAACSLFTIPDLDEPNSTKAADPRPDPVQSWEHMPGHGETAQERCRKHSSGLWGGRRRKTSQDAGEGQGGQGLRSARRSRRAQGIGASGGCPGGSCTP